MKISNKKSLMFMIGAVVLVLILFYFVSSVNIEGLSLLQQDLQNIQNDLNKTKDTGDPHANWNIIQNDVSVLNKDLNTTYNSNTVSPINTTSSSPASTTKPVMTTSSLLLTSSPALTTTPVMTTAALTTTPVMTTAASTTLKNLNIFGLPKM